MHFKVATSGLLVSFEFFVESRLKDQWQKNVWQKINAFSYILAIHFFAISAFERSPIVSPSGMRLAGPCLCARERRKSYP
jgi:hypothetical protein